MLNQTSRNLIIKFILSALFINCLFIIGNCLPLAGQSTQIGTSAFGAPRYYGQELIVTAAKIPQLISESSASITVVTKEEIKASGATNVADALRFVSGLDVKSTGYPAGEITLRLRGSTSDQVLLLVDGRRINSPQGGWNQFDSISLNNIEKIEVVRGPASALYGADAVGGVINVISKKGIEPETKISASLSSYDTQNYSFAHSLSEGAISGFFALESMKSNGHRANSDYSGQDFSGKLNFEMREKVNIALSTNYYQMEKGIPNTIITPSLTDRQTDKKNHLELSGNIENLEIRAYQNQFDRLFFSTANSRHKNWTEGLEVELKSPFLISGVELRRDQIESTENSRHAVYNLASFLQKEINFNKLLKVVLGVRGDEHSTFGGVISPRLGLVYHPVASTTLRSSWGGSFRAPNFDDLYWPTTTWAAGNLNLKPERAQTFDIGIDQQFNTLTTASLGWFSSEVKDMIDWAPDSGGTWRPSNVYAAKLQGVEVELKRKFSSLLSGFINYTYLKAVNSSTNNELIYKPNNKANIGLRFDNTRQTAYLNLRFVDKQFTDVTNTDILPSYTVVDTGLESAPFIIKINNLFDINYQESRDYPMPGRTYTLGIAHNY
ncbi:MAG: hypothetical protein FD145_349 [Candidatus Saganbacteria bacterium]|uniref:TonB-dependent receptor n=1 Tax=Candidatus Saganbacteria bacterium TaxID=2575572 RepID=A0A833L233_UNCSA|nr:MAG: hypothetical protein FD145_349 [Candidatus Saganbacteria bacterium]